MIASSELVKYLYLIRPYYLGPDGKVGHDGLSP
jgi:hypothetical protein